MILGGGRTGHRYLGGTNHAVGHTMCYTVVLGEISHSANIATIYDVNLFLLTTVCFAAKGMGDPSLVTPVARRCCQGLQSALPLSTRKHETSLESGFDDGLRAIPYTRFCSSNSVFSLFTSSYCYLYCNTQCFTNSLNREKITPDSMLIQAW